MSDFSITMYEKKRNINKFKIKILCGVFGFQNIHLALFPKFINHVFVAAWGDLPIFFLLGGTYKSAGLAFAWGGSAPWLIL